MPQYLSRDPTAGRTPPATPRYLSQDPQAGRPSRASRAWDVASTSVIPHRLLEKGLQFVDAPRQTRSVGEARLRGFVAGGFHGVADAFLSPLSLVGAGSARAIKGITAVKGLSSSARAAKAHAATGTSMRPAPLPTRTPKPSLPPSASTAVPLDPRITGLAPQVERRLAAGRAPGAERRASMMTPAEQTASGKALLTDPTLPRVNVAAAMERVAAAKGGAPGFRPTTSKGPRATVEGAKGLSGKDIAAVEEAIAARTGVSPRITGIRPTPEAQRTVEVARAQRHGAYKTSAELDKGFKTRLGSEKGAMTPDFLKAVGRGLQQVRVASMLSGLALPKSMLGNVSAIGHAAAETGSLKPLKEAFRLPTNLKLARAAFKAPSNPAAIQGMGRVNLPGRAMSAMDETSQAVLQRAGLSKAKGQELLLTSPDAVGGKFGEALQTGLGKYLVPFQRTPFNQFSEGLLRMSGKRGKVPLALAGGAGLAGAGAGTVTDDPRLLGLGTALAGPSGLPFALGSATTAGIRAGMRGALPFNELAFRDLVDPIRPFRRPAFIPAYLEP